MWKVYTEIFVRMVLFKLSVLCKRVAVCLIWLLLSTCQSCQAVASWKRFCQEAYRLHRDGNPKDAWYKYNQALGALGPNAPSTELELDIRLNMATMNIDSHQFERARSELKALGSRIMLSRYRDTLLAMRYWRRVCDLEGDTRNLAGAVAAQKQVLRIARLHFEQGSPFCLEEERKLMLWSVRNGEIDSALKLARRLKRHVNSLEARQTKERFLVALKEFSAQSAVAVMNLSAQGDVGEAKRVLDLIRYDVLTPHDYLDWLHQIANRADSIKSPLTAQLQEEALTLSKSMLPNRVAMQTYADSLSYFIGAKIKANSYDQKLEELQRERIRIEGELLPPEKRNESYGYLELKALLGMTLAKEGKFAEAEKVADDIVPSPRITEGVIFEGLYQLRIQLLAEHALAVGDRAGIEKQFGKLVELYKSMSLIKDKQRLLHLWEGMEAGYYSRLEARTRARKVS